MLYRALFDNATFQDWLHGTHRLHLFLDSLDEGLLSIPTLARFLSVELARYRDHLTRLSLRITCRAAEWPGTFEEQLLELWSHANVQVFRLAPLRREDVLEAARANGLDADLFLGEVDRKAAVPLANRPITLRFLLNLYREHGTFPSTQQALYEEGCLILCQEVSTSRRDARYTGDFTALQRQAAAARLAYLMIFTNRNIVWNGIDLGDAPGGSLQLYECSGGTEDADGNPLPVSESLLNETLATALFYSRGTDRREWAHRTYAEFLAACYLTSRQLPLPQIMMLLLQADESERRLVPQLHETATWLATMQPAVFKAIMEIDSEVLLQSDVATASDQDRAHLVAALLNLEPEERLWNVNMNLGQQYGKLLHPGIGAQLTAVISDHTFSATRRVVAIEIAEACRLQTFSPELVALALDPSEMRLVREAAAQAVAQVGDDVSKARLKPLAVGQHDDDPDDELKGHSLHAVWPAHLTAEELFTALIPPRREDFIGAYRSFLFSQVVPNLALPYLPIALRRVEQHPPRITMQGPASEFKPLADAIIRLASEHLDEPGVFTAFANLVLPYLLQFGTVPGLSPGEQETSRWINNDDTRHRLLEAVLPLLAQQTSDPIVWLVARPPLLLSRDLSWLIAYLADAQVEATQHLVASLIGRLIDSDDPAQVQTALEASERLPFLVDEVARIFQPVALGSPEAEQMKRAWFERMTAEPPPEGVQPSSPRTPPLLEHIEMRLNAFA